MTTQPPPKSKSTLYGILGCVVVLLFCGCCGGIVTVFMMKGAGDPVKVADEFLVDIDKSDIPAAMALSTAAVTTDELTALAKTYKEDAGGFADHSFAPPTYINDLCDLEGIVHFKGDKTVDFKLRMELTRVDGKWKVNLFEVSKK